MMKKRIFVAMMAAAMAMTSLAGCGSGAGKSTGGNAEAKVEAPTEPFGDTIKYDPSVEINDGKDISVELWEWGSDDLFQQVIDGYIMKIRQPNQNRCRNINVSPFIIAVDALTA